MRRLTRFLQIVGLAGLFIGLFPWIFSYQGEIFNQRVSIRALGDLTAVALILIGGIILFVSSFRERAALFLQELETAPPNFQRAVVWAASLLYLIGVVAHKIKAHVSLGTHAYDLGFFSNVCWNTFAGNWFFSSELERNFMGVHVNWILWPLSVFYHLYQGAEVLLVFQALFVAISLPVVWRLTSDITGSFTAGLWGAILFVSSPYIGHSVSNDFHPDLWLLPCLFSALLAWRKNRPIWLVVFSLLSLLAKEDVSVVVCGFGFTLLFMKGWRKTGAALFILSLGVFLFHTKVFIPRFLEPGSESLLLTRYPLLGSSFGEMITNLVHEPMRYARAFAYDPEKYWRFFCYFLPTAGLAFLFPLFLIPPIISVLPHFLSQASTQLQLADIYSLPAQPFIFCGAAFGAKIILDKWGRRAAVILGGGLFVVAGSGILASPRYYRFQPHVRVQAFKELKGLLPKEASVAAQQSLHPHFDTRPNIQLFPMGNNMPELQARYLKNPEYIVCDRIGNALPYDHNQLAVEITQLESGAAYEKLFERENFILFKRKNQEPPVWTQQHAPIN